MPIAEIKMLEGRDKKTKKQLIANLTKTIKETLQVDVKTIRIIIQEIPLDNFGVSGLPIKEYRSLNK